MKHVTRAILSLIIIIALLTPPLDIVFSQESPTPTPSPATNDQQRNELQQKIAEYEKKLGEVRSQKNTLAAQIEYMDTQTYIAGLRIEQTEQKIKDTEREINVLGARISSLDSSLDQLSQTLVQRIAAGYKNRSATLVDIVLDSTNAPKLINRLKYYQLAKERNQKSLLQVQEAKSNFEEQKDLREKKVEQLDVLQVQLNAQKKELDLQKVQKQKLLTDTQNDEITYQNLLQQARSQLNSFRSFVQTSGASGIIPANGLGNGSDGNYFSQRDARWATQAIGYSSENVLNVGCLLTSIAMVGKKNGADVSPATLASDTSRFWGSTAWMRLPWPGVAGKAYSSVGNIDSELNAGNYVIAGVKINSCASGGNHFVVLTRKEGGEYIMHDPIYGPDVKFSDHYSTICSSATFR